MAVESLRGCGFRKVGGLYLCGSGSGMTCDRMPYELDICPTCGSGVKFTRGFTWIDWDAYAGSHRFRDQCRDELYPFCPVCEPDEHPQPYGLLWVGEQFYTPEEFIKEALTLGVSRRIAAVPKNLKLGETWLLYAHIKACGTRLEDQGDGTEKRVGIPGVFYAHRPQTVELLIWESDATEAKLAELEKKHITPIIIPDGDVDHDPKTPLKMDQTDREYAESMSKIDAVRKSIA